MKKVLMAILLVGILAVSVAEAATTTTNYVTAEEAVVARDWRFKNGIWVDSGSVVNLEGVSGDSYFVYSSGSMDLYVDGTRVRQFASDIGTVPLPVNLFSIYDSTTPLQLSATTSPALSTQNNMGVINWPDGNASQAQVTFRVPDDYRTGGAFRGIFDENANATRAQIDFSVFVNSAGTAWDTTSTDQTPVARTNLAGTPELVTLSVATDFATLTGGDIVSLRVFPNDSVTTNALEQSYMEFYYYKK